MFISYHVFKFRVPLSSKSIECLGPGGGMIIANFTLSNLMNMANPGNDTAMPYGRHCNWSIMCNNNISGPQRLIGSLRSAQIRQDKWAVHIWQCLFCFGPFGLGSFLGETQAIENVLGTYMIDEKQVYIYIYMYMQICKFSFTGQKGQTDFDWILLPEFSGPRIQNRHSNMIHLKKKGNS